MVQRAGSQMECNAREESDVSIQIVYLEPNRILLCTCIIY